jgi:hypothetical protein
MSSEPPPQPVSDTFNQSQWGLPSTSGATDRAWVTLNFLSKVNADTASQIITFLTGIRTDRIRQNTGTNIDIGVAGSVARLRQPTLLDAIASNTDNSTLMPSTAWVQGWWANILSAVAVTFSQLTSFSAGIATNTIQTVSGTLITMSNQTQMTLGAKTSALETVALGGTANVYLTASIVDICNGGLTRIGNGASTVQLGSATNTAVNMYNPKLLSVIASSEDNSTNIPSTAWIAGWWSNIKTTKENVWTLIQTFNGAIEVTAVNPVPALTDLNFANDYNQKQNVLILSGDYDVIKPRGNVKISCGNSNNTTVGQNNVEILTGVSYGDLAMGNARTNISTEGRTYLNSVIASANDIDILNANYLATSKGSLNIQGGNCNIASTNGNFNLQHGTTTAKVTIGNSLSSIDLKAGAITLYFPLTPNYTVTADGTGAGKIGEIISGNYAGGTSAFTLGAGTEKDYSSITLTAVGVYSIFFQGAVVANGNITLLRLRVESNVTNSPNGTKYGELNTYIGSRSGALSTNSICSTVYNAGTRTYTAKVYLEFAGVQPEAIGTDFLFLITRIA